MLLSLFERALYVCIKTYKFNRIIHEVGNLYSVLQELNNACMMVKSLQQLYDCWKINKYLPPIQLADGYLIKLITERNSVTIEELVLTRLKNKVSLKLFYEIIRRFPRKYFPLSERMSTTILNSYRSMWTVELVHLLSLFSDTTIVRMLAIDHLPPTLYPTLRTIFNYTPNEIDKIIRKTPYELLYYVLIGSNVKLCTVHFAICKMNLFEAIYYCTEYFVSDDIINTVIRRLIRESGHHIFLNEIGNFLELPEVGPKFAQYIPKRDIWSFVLLYNDYLDDETWIKLFERIPLNNLIDIVSLTIKINKFNPILKTITLNRSNVYFRLKLQNIIGVSTI